MTPVGVLLAALVAPPGVDLAFPSPEGPLRVRVVATVDGRPPDAAWGAFLGRLFAHSDRDGDGSLSRAEAARLFPLPLPGGRAATMDFPRLDADGDGCATPAEFRAFYRRAGFAPVVTVVRPPTAERLAPSVALFRHLDRDGDGSLSRAELGGATDLLRRLDEDEDEVLSPAELLALGPTESVAAAGPAPRVGRVGGRPDGLLLADLGGGHARFESRSGRARVGADARSLDFAGGSVAIREPDVAAGGGFQAAKEFTLAQFAGALGGGAALRKADAEADAGSQVVAGLFDPADRDGDGRLTPTELREFLDLIELGVGCQLLVTVEDRGPGLLDRLDANGDGRLSGPELARAAGLPPGHSTASRLFRVGLSRGPVGPAFGPVPTPESVARPKAAPAGLARGPAWFRAMDRNGDGSVSAAEFRGSRARFAELDRDANGWVSLSEADAAGG